MRKSLGLSAVFVGDFRYWLDNELRVAKIVGVGPKQVRFRGLGRGFLLTRGEVEEYTYPSVVELIDSLPQETRRLDAFSTANLEEEAAEDRAMIDQWSS